MKEPYLIHISIGSNQGDRLANLQQAVEMIYQEVGDVVAIARIYQTPAWGFTSEDFYNSCIAVHSFYETESVLQRLLLIEKKLGRKRNEGSGYRARSIDLDIVFSSEGVLDSATLRVPHPGIPDRKFVLQPLSDIAAEQEHPILKKTVKNLLQETSDTSVITPIKGVLQNPKNRYNLTTLQYLTVEGNIGAGKTSLATTIAQEFNAKLVLERFEDNPFLPKFYEDMERYAFPLEMSFLADRYQRLQDDIAQLDLFKDFVVSDYDVFKSLIFAKVTLQSEEYKLYKKVFDIMYTSLPKPGLYVYLYQNTQRLLDNIRKRGRSYEQKIPEEYLSKINKGYLQFIQSQPQLPIKIIDISHKDFVRNREDYIWVLDQIKT